MMGSVYPRHHDDSEVPWMRETVARLVAKGVEVEILAPSWRSLKSHQIDGVQVHRFRYAPGPWEFLTHDEGAPSKLARNPLFQLLAIPYIIIGALMCFWLTWRRGYDALHVHWPFPHALMVLPAQLILRTPVLLNFHGASLLLQRKFFFVRPCLKLVIKMANGVLTNSSFTRDKVLDVLDVDVMLSPYGSPIEVDESIVSIEIKSHVINEQIDQDSMDAVSQDSNEPAVQNFSHTNPFKILFVGRHIERKGIEYLIQAFQLLASRHPDLVSTMQLEIVGGGESTDTLKVLAAKTPNLPIIFPGKISTEDLMTVYQEADLFVLPAIVDSKGDTEGLGVVLIEAIVSHTAIIASRVGGIVDVVINEKTGLLVEEKNPQDLMEAILKVYSDEKLRTKLCAQAQIHAQEFFDWEVITLRLIAEYERVIQASAEL